MALRDEIRQKTDKLGALAAWIDAQKNADEWYEIIVDINYSAGAIQQLLKRHGFITDTNVIYRLRQRHGAK
jgi:hypothetical protein